MRGLLAASPKRCAFAAALLGLMSAGTAAGQSYTPAETARLRDRAIGPMLESVSMISFGQGCHILGPAGDPYLEGRYEGALAVLGDHMIQRALRVLGRWNDEDLDAYKVARREGAGLATPAKCAALRRDPDASVDIKRLIDAYDR